MTNPDNVGGLLPCPFCGGEAERIDFGPGSGDNEGGSCIACTKCQASGPVEFGYKENFVSNWNRRELCRAAPAGGGVERDADFYSAGYSNGYKHATKDSARAGGDGLRLLVKELRESLEGVVRVADRQTNEFDRAREAITRAAHVFVNAGDSEAQFIADGENLDCPTCGGSGHATDSAPAGSGEVLTADMTKALPGGALDDTTFQQIEDALDRADAPMRDESGKWLTLSERIAALIRKLSQGADYVMVPRVATEAMMSAWLNSGAKDGWTLKVDDYIRAEAQRDWTAMIAASQGQEGGRHE